MQTTACWVSSECLCLHLCWAFKNCAALGHLICQSTIKASIKPQVSYFPFTTCHTEQRDPFTKCDISPVTTGDTHSVLVIHGDNRSVHREVFLFFPPSASGVRVVLTFATQRFYMFTRKCTGGFKVGTGGREQLKTANYCSSARHTVTGHFARNTCSAAH